MKEYISGAHVTWAQSLIWQLTGTQLFKSHLVPRIGFTCQSHLKGSF